MKQVFLDDHRDVSDRWGSDLVGCPPVRLACGQEAQVLMAASGRWAVLLHGPDDQTIVLEGPMVAAWYELSRSGRAWPTAVVVQGSGFQATFDTPSGPQVLTQDGTRVAGLDASGPVELDRPALPAEELAALLSNC